MLTEVMLAAIVAMAFNIPSIISDLTNTFKGPHNISHNEAFSVPYFGLIGFALFFCKDCINGQSPVKRYLGLQVVNDKNGQAASPLRCFVRNLFCIIWPVEGIVVLTNTSRRIGDRIAGTKLVFFDPELKRHGTNVLQVLMCLILSYSIILFIFSVSL